MPSSRPLRLLVGAAAPLFTARTWEDKGLSLTDFRGRAVWLAFYRHVQCPFCNMRLHAVDQLRDKLEGRLQCIAVFQSPAANFALRPSKVKIWYPMISDPDERLYGLYGLESSMGAVIHPGVGLALVQAASQGLPPTPHDGTFSRVPADFLINEGGMLEDVFYGKLISDHIPIERVEGFAAKRQQPTQRVRL